MADAIRLSHKGRCNNIEQVNCQAEFSKALQLYPPKENGMDQREVL